MVSGGKRKDHMEMPPRGDRLGRGRGEFRAILRNPGPATHMALWLLRLGVSRPSEDQPKSLTSARDDEEHHL